MTSPSSMKPLAEWYLDVTGYYTRLIRIQYIYICAYICI